MCDRILVMCTGEIPDRPAARRVRPRAHPACGTRREGERNARSHRVGPWIVLLRHALDAPVRRRGRPLSASAAPAFLQPANLVNIMVQSSSAAIVAIGMNFVLLTAGVDLSVGSIMFVSAALAAKVALSGLGLPVASCRRDRHRPGLRRGQCAVHYTPEGDAFHRDARHSVLRSRPAVCGSPGRAR